MMKLYLYPNSLSSERREAALRCVDSIMPRFECVASPSDAAWLHCSVGSAAEADAIVAFGGDGTMLRAAQLAMRHNKPLLGVNTGRLGYLCALCEADLPAFDEQAWQRLRGEERSVLAFSWQGEEKYALNELIIAKGDYGTTLDVSAALDCTPLDTWQGDGVLLVTPTGSSAYNQSAGGPRLIPGCGCFVLTPLCPTGMNRSPIVFPDSAEIVLHCRPRFSPQEARLYADGVFIGALDGSLRITRAPQKLILMQK